MTRATLHVGATLQGEHLGQCSCGASVSYIIGQDGIPDGGIAHTEPTCDAFLAYDPDGNPYKPGGIVEYMRAHITGGATS